MKAEPLMCHLYLLNQLKGIVYIILIFVSNNLITINGFSYAIILPILLFILSVFAIIYLLYLYLSGLNNLCHFWYSNNWVAI